MLCLANDADTSTMAAGGRICARLSAGAVHYYKIIIVGTPSFLAEHYLRSNYN